MERWGGIQLISLRKENGVRRRRSQIHSDAIGPGIESKFFKSLAVSPEKGERNSILGMLW